MKSPVNYLSEEFDKLADCLSTGSKNYTNADFRDAIHKALLMEAVQKNNLPGWAETFIEQLCADLDKRGKHNDSEKLKKLYYK